MYDVMGMSHQQTRALQIWHNSTPEKLVVMTECCSCETQRGEDADLPGIRTNASAVWVPGTSTVFSSNENAACLRQKVLISDQPEWVGGTFVWTLHDYLGEPAENNKWPHISSSFGMFDLCGFEKPGAFWFRSWWLGNVSAADAGRPAADRLCVCICWIVSAQLSPAASLCPAVPPWA